MRFVLFLIFVMIRASVFSQSYVPMLDNRNEWQIGYCDDFGCNTDSYFTDGDTIAFGHQYKILDGYHYISRKFLLREEIQEKKIYLSITYSGNTNEYLLYDFSLEEGDSIRMLNPVSPFPPDLGYFKLDSIRSKPRLENQQSRFFYFSATDSNHEGFGYLPVWVEGVGSLSLINAPGGDPNYFGVGQLSCFWKNENLYFHDDQMGIDCESVLNIQQFEKSKVRFAVSRQKKGMLLNAEKIKNFRIYDLSGRIQKSGELNGVSSFQIDLSSFKKGIYVLQYIEDQQWQKISFVIR